MSSSPRSAASGNRTGCPTSGSSRDSARTSRPASPWRVEFRGHHTELLTRARSSGDGVRGHHTELLTRSSGRVSFPPWLDSGESGTPYPTLDAGLWPWEVKRDITKWHSICPKAYCIKHLRACPRGQCPHIRTISVRSLFPPQAV